MHPSHVMFCSDDKHPNELVLGYLNNIAARAVAKGISPMKVLRAMSYNPVKHYGLDLGLLQPNDPADFIEVNNLKEFRVLSTYINGELVAENGKSVIESISEKVLNHFDSKMISENDIQVLGNAGDKVRIIEALDGQLFTHELIEELEVKEGALQSDVNRDILKLVVINRY